ncbi:MAG: M23 family metallopeptidase, partial [bacterium]|nr:M23 family metallopeptidase [bacterium]
MDGDKNVTAVFEEVSGEDIPRFHLPWGLGEIRFTGQANDGEFSHQYPPEEGGGTRFAWDYTVDIGSPVLAVAAGRVVHVVNDVPNNPEGAVVDDPQAEANVIQIDHGNGLQSLYAHMDLGGAVVEPGQVGARGQYLGRSGNSGYTTGPHLHYEVLDTIGRSAATGFVESSRDNGIAEESDPAVSQNLLDPESLAGYV